MAPAKNNKTAPRARLAHKLARYVRANPIHLQSRLSSQNPSTTHLSIFLFIQLSAVPPKEDLEITLTTGIQLMMNPNCIKEKILNPNLPPADHQSNLAASSFFSQVLTEEEELLYLNPSPQATCWSLDHTLSTVFLLKESTQPTLLPPQPEFHWKVSLPTLMMPGSRDKEPGLNLNWRTLQKPD